MPIYEKIDVHSHYNYHYHADALNTTGHATEVLQNGDCSSSYVWLKAVVSTETHWLGVVKTKILRSVWLSDSIRNGGVK